MGLFEGTQIKTNIAKVSAECHSFDCSGDSSVVCDVASSISLNYLFLISPCRHSRVVIYNIL